MKASRPGLAWDYLADYALAPDALPRLLAGMGFDARVGSLARGDIGWWMPEYSGGAKAHRDMQAALNRRRRDAEVLLMLRRESAEATNHRLRPGQARGTVQPAGDLLVCLDTYEGAWRSPDGSLRGASVIDLGAFMWGCRYGQAGFRIARLLGWQRIPEQQMGKAAA